MIPFTLTKSYFQWLVIVVCGIYPITSLSSGQHQRNFTVQLAIIAGDCRILLSEDLSLEKRKWIAQRLIAELNILPLLSRYASEEAAKKDTELMKKIYELVKNRDHLEKLVPLAVSLMQRYPIQFPYKLTQNHPRRAEKKAS